jgi:hypothetical protein
MLLTFLFFFMRAAVALSVSVPRCVYCPFVLVAVRTPPSIAPVALPPSCDMRLPRNCVVDIHLASLRLQISMNCLISETSEGILGECDESGRIVRFGRDRELSWPRQFGVWSGLLATHGPPKGGVARGRMRDGGVTTSVARRSMRRWLRDERCCLGPTLILKFPETHL